MKPIKVDSYFFKYKVENHNYYKNKFREWLTAFPTTPIMGKGQIIHSSDYNFNYKSSNIVPLKYLVKDPILESVKQFQKILNKTCIISRLQVSALWFQTYARGNFHTWHTHNKSDYSAVYYIDLNKDNARTSFSNLVETFDVEVEEGDILIFPSTFWHCSKENNSDSYKNIISFNMKLKNKLETND